MIAYRLLSSDDFDSLYDCFLTAFSDYAVDMQMSREQFQQRITRDGVSLQHLPPRSTVNGWSASV